MAKVKKSKKVEKEKAVVKKTIKPKKEKKENKALKFLKDVKAELKKVRWPNKQEFLKYTSATLFFIIFFALFFALSDVIIYGLKQLVR